MQVPDEPQFTVGPRVGVAAWVNPTTVTGDQPIVIKRLNNQTSFSLGIHNGNIEMSVVLSTGKTVISRAPIAPDVWTHVAGMFDGTFVFLFINGQQFGQVFAAGTMRNVFAPLRIGATTQTQFFDGTIDDVFVSTCRRPGQAHRAVVHRPAVDVDRESGDQWTGPVRHHRALRRVGDRQRRRRLQRQRGKSTTCSSSLDPTISTNFTTSSFQNAIPGKRSTSVSRSPAPTTPTPACTSFRSRRQLREQLRAAEREAHLRAHRAHRLLRLDAPGADDHQHQRRRRSGGPQHALRVARRPASGRSVT